MVKKHHSLIFIKMMAVKIKDYHYNTVTCIYYLIKDNTIEGGDLEFEKYNVINILEIKHIM